MGTLALRCLVFLSCYVLFSFIFLQDSVTPKDEEMTRGGIGDVQLGAGCWGRLTLHFCLVSSATAFLPAA